MTINDLVRQLGMAVVWLTAGHEQRSLNKRLPEDSGMVTGRTR
jgi:hypothetical protein